MLAPNAQNPLLTGPILPTLMRLSLPNMGAMVATSLVAIAETSYVGILGTPALAGLALVFPFVMLQQMMSGGAMGGGVSASIARALGANDVARANALALHASFIGLSAGLVMALVIFLFGPSIFALLGGRDAALDEAVAYARIYSIAAFCVWMTNTLASIVRGCGNMRVPSATIFIAALARSSQRREAAQQSQTESRRRGYIGDRPFVANSDGTVTVETRLGPRHFPSLADAQDFIGF